MFNSFSTALSALSAFSTAVDVVGNNLANLNTAGYKTSVVAFHDLVTQSLGAEFGDTQVGFGVGRPTTVRQFSQGAIQSSSGPLDVAIQGDGFFILRTAQNGTVYTRDGHLKVDTNGFLTTATGERVQGWTETNGSLTTTGPVTDITLPVGVIRPPTPTTSFSLDMNLNAAAAEDTTFSKSIEVYDSLGAAHVVTVTFTKATTANEWDYAISVPDTDVESPVDPVTGTLTFDAEGRLESPTNTDDMPQIEISGLTNGAAPMTVAWNIFNGTSPRITQFSQPSAVAANAQDGAPPSQLIRVGIGDGGLILAQYSNGKQSVVGQLAMAAIRNPDSLIAVGNNNYQLSARSALPAVGVAGTGGRGTISGGSIESSTVDLAREFTNLIVLQRGYQANAKVVTTVDEMSQETLNLKR
jgi:flagellar hook protein FlgE